MRLHRKCSGKLINLKEVEDYIKDYPMYRKAMEYGRLCHDSVNQLYDGKPYSYHLNMVNSYAIKYLYLILKPEEELDVILDVMASTWTHDCIEDCRETYNDVKKATNKRIADLAYAVTDEKGKTRDERKNEKFYNELVQVPFADYVKICDRLANAKYSKDNKSRMSDAYKKEYLHFKEKLYKEEYNPMFDELDELLK